MNPKEESMFLGHNGGNLDDVLRRFKMSAFPDPGGDKYEERLTNWFLEGAFFRDFVYRDQKGKGERGDLADGLVLFDDTALFVQSKAQTGTKDGTAWAEKHIQKALKQVCYGERMLRERLVSHVVSDTLGPVSFDPDHYKKRIGLIVVDQVDTEPFVASDLVPEISQQTFPITVLSLADFLEISWRFDTAPDFLFYLEERRLLESSGMPFQVHREIDMVSTMLDSLPQRMRQYRPDITADVLVKSVDAFRRKVTGELHNSKEWKYSLLVDDIIAHLHDRDPDLPWNQEHSAQGTVATAELLSCLDRTRRAVIGEKLNRAARAAVDGDPQAFWHGTRFNRCCYVFLFSDLPRKERLGMANVYLLAAMAKSGMDIGLVVATNSVASGGRAYDVAVRFDPLTDSEREFHLTAPDLFMI